MNISEIEGRLLSEFQSFKVGRRRCPLLFERGLPDAAIHAAGVSYLLSLGLEWGLPAMVEYPITLHASGQWKDTGRLFPDSVWFHPNTHKPWIVFEFERFERGDETKIRQKAENLALSYYQGEEEVELCVLVYWLRSALAPKSVSPLFDPFRKGFERGNAKAPPPKCKFWAYKCVVCQMDKQQDLAQLSALRTISEGCVADQSSHELLVLADMRRIDG